MSDVLSLTLPKATSRTRRRFRRPRLPDKWTWTWALIALATFALTVQAALDGQAQFLVIDAIYTAAYAQRTIARHRRRPEPQWLVPWFVLVGPLAIITGIVVAFA